MNHETIVNMLRSLCPACREDSLFVSFLHKGRKAVATGNEMVIQGGKTMEGTWHLNGGFDRLVGSGKTDMNLHLPYVCFFLGKQGQIQPPDLGPKQAKSCHYQ